MSKRILRTVPAAILVTTSLSWNLPAAAQGTLAPAAPSSHSATGAVQKPPMPRAPGTATQAPPPSTGSQLGGNLPKDLQPAMPASSAAPAQPAAAPGAMPSGAPKKH
ncbi:hypothetical protein [Ottowia testudinis]|uniref:Uncharacterized protein n=1 Tax=Ottowia testudinis TaxID=2816950 RepID=A0A975CH73_9BURK|nr:hypothetical protein [Ottowia testudinis]QTD45519.1 hypothetical protein J1M35_00895 [Ottowia testudinis]